MKNFLIVGRTGVGKSSFINSVFGREIAETSTDEACTKIIKHYAKTFEFGDICLVDTPGFGEEENDLDQKYIQMIKKSFPLEKIDTLVYVATGHDTRFRPIEKSTINIINNEYGNLIWENCWLVLTFLAWVDKSKRDEIINNKIENFQYCIKNASNGLFPGFKKVILIDNKSNDWTDNFIPFSEIFS